MPSRKPVLADIQPGQYYPLGATPDKDGVNFALFSANATRVELCLFDADGRVETGRVDLPEYTDEVWHGFLPHARPGLVYGYRVHGPHDPAAGHRFNAAKLLLDPYAKAWTGRLQWDPVLFSHHIGTPSDADPQDAAPDGSDSAPAMPKARVVAGSSSRHLAGLTGPRARWSRTLIYEAHVKGLTRLNPAVPEGLRGTFAGLAHTAMIDYLKALGVTSIELLPVHAFVDEPHLSGKGLCNYWGYNTLGFFTPHPGYLSGDDILEFREMVSRLHDAGLEVLLDVVYNHTAEGNEHGPTLAFKGIDNASYYRLQADDARLYVNDTGTGNTLNLSHPRVLQMVMDSLRYWTTEMGVDGFRFDLGTVLGREAAGFDAGSGFFDACRQDPILNRVKMIAEPWDCGPGGYQMGGFPPGWAEWNDQFRDTVRGFWRGDPGRAAGMAHCLTASAQVFNRRGRRPWASVNFLTAHDGFTLHDLVSHERKHNEANGEDNQDGSSNNLSWHCGTEGATEDEAILVLRERQKRNLLVSLLLGQGTPMLLAGDEFGRTQQGNNNAYCQDNEINWVNWQSWAPRDSALLAFVRQVIWLRQNLGVFRPRLFATGEVHTQHGTKDVAWLNPLGAELGDADWADEQMRSFGMLTDGNSHSGVAPDASSDIAALTIFNAHHDLVRWTLPAVPNCRDWVRLIDTNVPQMCEAPAFSAGSTYEATGRSVLVFVAARSDQAQGFVSQAAHRIRAAC